MRICRTNQLVALGFGCTLALNLACADGADVRSAIKLTNADMAAAFVKGDGAAVAALYAKDGEVLPVGAEPIKGTDAIREFWQGAMNSGVAVVALTTLEVYAAGRTATEVGRYELSDKAGKSIDHGKYIVVWQKIGEHWKLLRDIYSTSIPVNRK